MKIFVWADSPTVDTGFGVVSKNLLPRWQKMGHEISILGVNEFGDQPRRMAEYNFPIYPTARGNPETLYGFNKLWQIIAQESPDVLVFINDPWLIGSALSIKPANFPDIKVVGYYPTDAPPLKEEWTKFLNELSAQVCYSKYAEDVVIKSNKGSRPDNLYQIYHGVDTNTFFPINQSVARSELGIPTDLFVVGMVARNQPRKRFDILAMAFAEFAKNKDNAKLYLHTGLQDVGFDITDLARQLGISNKLIMTEDITPIAGVEPSRLNLIYNSFDVNTLISLGDGFGLPVAESMATGCAQIVSGHSCLQELVEGHGGETVKNAAYIMNSGGMNTWAGVSDTADLVKKLELLYENPELRFKHAQDGYNFITQKQFTWDYAANQFDKVFKKIHHILDLEREEE